MKICEYCKKEFTPNKFNPTSQRFCSKRCRWNSQWERRKESQKKTYLTRRFKLIDKLGGKCVACGLNDKYILTFDHIYDNRIGKNDTTFIRKGLNDPESFKKQIQILCWNCNSLKQFHRYIFNKRYPHLAKGKSHRSHEFKRENRRSNVQIVPSQYYIKA